MDETLWYLVRLCNLIEEEPVAFFSARPELKQFIFEAEKHAVERAGTDSFGELAWRCRQLEK